MYTKRWKERKESSKAEYFSGCVIQIYLDNLNMTDYFNIRTKAEYSGSISLTPY